MSLAAGAGAGEDEPTLGVFRKLGGGGHALCEHLLAGGVWQRPFQVCVGKGDTGQSAQVAVASQCSGAGVGVLVLLARAGDGLPEVGMADVHTAGDPAAAVALGAEVSGRFAVGETYPSAVRSL